MKKGIYFDNKRNSWYIHTTYKGRTITIRGFATKKECSDNYDLAIDKWVREHELASLNSEYRVIVKEYLEYRSKIVRPESLRKDITQLKYFDTIFGSDTLTNVFQTKRLRFIYDKIVKNDIYSNSKKSRLVLVFKDFAKYCHQLNKIDDNTYNQFILIFLPIKESKQVLKTKRYIPISHFKAVLSEINKVNDKLFALAVSVLYFAGLRISELLGLLGSDIDLNEKKINVQRQLLTDGKLTTILKTTNSYRQVPINNELLELMRKNLTKPNKRVFNYSHSTFKRKLKEYEQNAKTPIYSCHEYRHSFCSNLALKITNMSECSYCAKVSGHTVSMFLDTYVKSMDTELENKFF